MKLMYLVFFCLIGVATFSTAQEVPIVKDKAVPLDLTETVKEPVATVIPIVEPTTVTATSTPDTTTSTTTTAPATTTPAPPNFDYGTWSFTDATSNKTCLIVRMAMRFNVTYKLENETTTSYLYVLPVKQVRVLRGSCDNTSDSIELAWGKPGAESQISLVFVGNKTFFGLSEMKFNINATDLLPNAFANQTINLVHRAPENHSDFETPIQMSYHCTRIQTLNVTMPDSTVNAGTVEIGHVQFEAFRTKADTKFSTARDCDAIDTPDIVPIAVGCALAGLVIVVLIAYLVGRRRAQARGYVSM